MRERLPLGLILSHLIIGFAGDAALGLDQRRIGMLLTDLFVGDVRRLGIPHRQRGGGVEPDGGGLLSVTMWSPSR